MSFRVPQLQPLLARLGLQTSLGSVALALLLPLFLAGCGPSEAEPPSRIFLITVDTLRADHVEFQGYPAETTPFLSKLAEESAVFTNAFSSAGHTTPSHASLFTSLYPDQHGARENGQSFGRKLDTIATILRERGYRTAAFSSVNFLVGLRAGFDFFDAHERAASIYRPAHLTLERASRWISRQDDTHPIFVWVHLFDVHEWGNASTDDRKRLKSISVTSELNRSEKLAFLRENHGMDSGGETTEEQLLRAIDNYDRRIVLVDRELERFFETNNSSGEGNHSLWIFTADHGEGLFSHNYKGHGLKLFKEQLHVPLLIHSTDGFGSGRRIEGLARHVDILPTLAELTGSPVPPTQGLSLVSMIDGSSELDPTRTAYAQRKPVLVEKKGWVQTPDEMRTVYDLDYKYIHSTKEEDEFYDLRADPLEAHNLIESAPAELERYKQVMSAYRSVFDQRKVKSSEVSEETKAELRSLGYTD